MSDEQPAPRQVFTLGWAFRTAREAWGWSQGELASKAGVKRGVVSKLENDVGTVRLANADEDGGVGIACMAWNGQWRSDEASPIAYTLIGWMPVPDPPTADQKMELTASTTPTPNAPPAP